MTVHVLLGGNGYIGRQVTRQLLAADPTAAVIAVSSSGKNQLTDPRLTTLAADASNYESLASALPQTFDTITSLVGRPAKNQEDNRAINIAPVENMIRLANQRQAKALGFIGGTLGPKSFTSTKAQLISRLEESGLALALVSPTLVIGGDRADTMAKLTPLFKALGTFIPSLKPVQVQDLAQDLTSQLIALGA